MIAPRIVSENLILRPLEKEDLTHKVKWYNDPEVSRTLILSERLELDKTILWFGGIQNNPSRIDWLIENTNSRPIGLISLVGINTEEKSAEIYIVIGEKDYWGRGVMLEAETRVIQWAIDTLGLEKIWAEARIDNIASAITMKKLGFKINKALTKKQTISDQAVDILRFDLKRENFRALHQFPGI
jgi:RimJ/RimL family protein N-acetyltransferase